MRHARSVALTVAVVAFMMAASAWVRTAPRGESAGLDMTILGKPIPGQLPDFILFLLPVTTALVGLVFATLPTIARMQGALSRSTLAYMLVWHGVLATLLALHLILLAGVMGTGIDIVRACVVVSGALLVVVGNYLPKVRLNPVFGVRTPWTVRNERVWDRTHRVVGTWLVAAGGIAILGGWLFQDRLFAVMSLLLPTLAAAIAAIVYSAIISSGPAGPTHRILRDDH